MPQVDLNPQTVLADYEPANRNSVSTIWPCTVDCGGLFHFKQAICEGDVYYLMSTIRSSPHFQMMSESSLSTWSLLGSVVGWHNATVSTK